MKSKRKITIIFVVFILILVCFLISFKLSNNKNENIEIVEDYYEEEIKDDFAELEALYKSNKEINDDYIGQLFFDSGLIDLPIVQGETNDTYMRTDWSTMKYDIGGSIFMDSSNDIDTDQNLIIYGHNYSVEYDNKSEKMFSPLRVLREESNYEKNKIINLFLGGKLLKYQVVAVYTVKVETEDDIQYIADGEPIYVIKNYTNDEFNEYIEKVKQRQFYNTYSYIDNTDRLLTLQTCIENETNKLVILAKLNDTK